MKREISSDNRGVVVALIVTFRNVYPSSMNRKQMLGHAESLNTQWRCQM